MSPTRRRKTRPGVVVALSVAAIAVIAAVAAFVVAPRLNDRSTSQSHPSVAAGVTAPASGAEAAAATSSAPYTIKPEPAKVATDAPVTRHGGRVDVLLTYAELDPATGAVQAGGFVAGIRENGGTCTLTLTQDGQQIRATSPAAADATTTMCGLLETPPGIGAGTWDAVLTYQSGDAEGTSRATKVTV